MSAIETKFGRRTVLGWGALLAGVATGVLPAAAQSTLVRIASPNGPTFESMKVVELVAKRISERTDGRLTFQIFPSAQLGTNDDVLEQASQGQPIIGYLAASFLAKYGVPDIAILDGPFLVEDNEQADRLATSDLMQGYYDKLAETAGIRVLAMNWFDGARHIIGSAGYPEPADLRGVKLRIPPVETWRKTFEPLGVIPTIVEIAEVYSALSQGVVDASESPLSSFRSNGWPEVAKHITLTGHFNSFLGWVISEQTFKSFSPEDQAIVLEEFLAGGRENSDRTKALADTFRAELEAQGVTFHDANVAAYREATASFYDSFPDWSEGLYDRVRAAAVGN